VYANRNRLTFSVGNKPAWASFDTSTGRLFGTPLPANVGTFGNIVISASDGTARATLPAFAVKVLPLSGLPTISGSPLTTAAVAQAYSFQPAAKDPNGLRLVFAVANKPAWLAFDSATGRLYGTPGTANVGAYNNIVITVYDGYGKAVLPAFGITVGASSANQPPSISGQPLTAINVSSIYSFMPTATAANGAALTFTIQNKPAWASFNTQSGLLSGTPGAASVGTFANILISVSDGKASAALPAFTIAVTQVSSGSATVAWEPPTQNTDNTPLTDLAGYHLYYGTAVDNLDHSVKVANPGLASYVIDNLSPATWYFAVTAYNTGGVESDRSATTSKVTK
jgi:hypothetical protein